MPDWGDKFGFDIDLARFGILPGSILTRSDPGAPVTITSSKGEAVYDLALTKVAPT